MGDMKKILSKVSKRINPTKSSMNNVQKFMRKIERGIKKSEVKAECFLGGSFAKDTHLKGDHDVDIFIRFDYDSHRDDDLSELLHKSLKAAKIKSKRLNGSRDYFQARMYDMDFEIVPVLKVDHPGKAKNVTDMSPIHVQYVNKHKKRKPGLSDHIRLTKQFCKANRVYGAESYIQGFSGHVLDLLVIFHGSFEKLLGAAADWKERVVIDMEDHWDNPLKQLNPSKLESPLVLVDPIQPDRNAAAALSHEKYVLFKSRAKKFLESPSIEFFEVSNLDIESVKERSGDNFLVVMEAWPRHRKEDVMGAKLRQVYEYMFDKLRDREWNVLESDWDFIKKEKKGIFYFIIDRNVGSFMERKGPPVSQTYDVKKFAKKHANTFVRGSRIYARIDRRHTDPELLAKDISKHKYVKERVRKVKFV